MAHHHDHAPRSFGRAFTIGVTLNLAFVIIEAFYGWKTGSLALLADAAHNLSDVGGLLLAWAAFGAAQLQPNMRHSYGWRKGSILASFVNAVVLLVAMGYLAWEAIDRLQMPSPVAAGTVMVVAGIGVVINSVTAWLFLAGSKGDLNIRGAFLHMAADALVSLGVVVAGAAYLWQGWGWIDPVMSLVIALVVVVGTWSLFRRSLHLLFDGVPEEIDLEKVQTELLALPSVVSVHDLHVWAMSTSDNAITAHLVMADGGGDHDQLLTLATEMLHERFEIRHTVLQLEGEAYAANCPTACGC
ncbi:cation diffusion facilitator family transporter [Halomonas sp. N3-2A]|uniref:cation diffusion facilitator family transporter n=1 Tax=Halomonas sp. N3-2A TaxID=2014541 RepID=UPI000B5B25C9|nr:cation diffusion facilitator family transporter [Halomonas sp. N3-2A]ASK18072.1 cation transporter [Halomonas sp. N3-2A]